MTAKKAKDDFEEGVDPDDQIEEITTSGERDELPEQPLPPMPPRDVRMLGPRPIPGVGPIGPRLELPVDGLTPFDQEIPSESITGPFDGFLAEVTDIFDDGVHARLRERQAIEAKRVGIDYTTNNEPDGYAVPLAPGNLTASRIAALPFPTRHDQARYLVAVGDIVAILAGRDGRHWYFRDDLPFPAVVIKATTSVKEDTAGGAGTTSLKVRRQAMSGNPASAVPTLANLQTAAAANIELSYVKVMGPTNVAHGYRCGDLVWVQRRGLYYYVVPASETFAAYIVDAGPDSESDFASNDPRYWVREYDSAATYSNNTYTSTDTTKTQTDPTGSGGRFGRWVCAWNLAELPGSTHLLTTVTATAGGAGAPGNAIYVTVFMYGDPSSAEHWYCFSVKPLIVTDGTNTVTDVTQITYSNMTVGDSGSGESSVEPDFETGVGIGLVMQGRIQVTDNGTITLDTNDWRGRHLRVLGSYYIGTEANADDQALWSSSSQGEYLVGTDYVAADQVIGSWATAAGDCHFDVDADDVTNPGKLIFTSSSFSTEYQFQFVILAAKQYRDTTNTHTCP